MFAIMLLVTSASTTAVGMATDGYREFEGQVEAIPAHPLPAPLTQWPCCWYHARVEKYASRPRPGVRP